MVMALNREPRRFEQCRNIRPYIVDAIERWTRNVPFLMTDVITAIRSVASRVPRALEVIDGRPHGMIRIMEYHPIKYKELRLWSKITNVGDSRGLQITLSALGHSPWVEPITLPADGVHNIGNQNERFSLHERID